LVVGGWGVVAATVDYWRISLKLKIFEWAIWWRGVIFPVRGERRLLEG
jgi:aarF domain-containing kinase